MTNEELLQSGRKAFQAGEIDRAMSIFAQVVKLDPGSEQGWLWLGKSCKEDGRKEYCFRQVLKINPYNMEAVEQLARLAKPAPPAAPMITPPFSSTKPPSSPAFSKPKLPQPNLPAVSPFLFDEPLEAAETPPVGTSEAAEPTAAPAPAATTDGEPLPGFLETPEPKVKKPNRVLAGCLWTLLIGVLILAAAAAYLYFSGVGLSWLPAGVLPSNLLPSGLFATATPGNIVIEPTSTRRPTASPTLTASPTAVLPTVAPTPKPTVAYTPAYAKVACPFTIPEGALVECGYVTVPEDRTSANSPSIRLAVAIFHSTSATHEPDPVVFLQGGPGGAAISYAVEAYKYLVEPYLEKRDFIVFDQRGTGMSDPSLECEEYKTVYLEDLRGELTDTSRGMIYANALRSCNSAMTIRGISLAAYSTVASADDVKDLLQALNYSKADLYGASYGTRLAQVVMRDHPEVVRSVIVDSVVPVETNIFDQDPTTIRTSLKNLFSGCAADPACNSAYPQLETVFWQVVNDLNDSPFSLTSPNLQGGTITENVSGYTLVSAVLGLEKASLAYTAPQLIYQVKNKDYSTIIPAHASTLVAFDNIDTGLYISMMCHEQVLTTTEEDLKAAIAGSDTGKYIRLPITGDLDGLFSSCKWWGAVPPFQGEDDQVVSDLPTLVMAGQYDSTTPPAWGQQLASHLSHSTFVEFPDQGHCPSVPDVNGCATKIIQEFLDHPEAKPDLSCLSQIPRLNFAIPYTGDPAVEFTTEQTTDISYNVPASWQPIDSGVYWRGVSPIDITQIGILETKMKLSDIQKWFSGHLYDFRGYDDALVPAGKRQANGLDWTLYTSTSYGRPVDLAITTYKGKNIVVTLFSHTDEHDPLYQTVFLPIIDSVQTAP